MLTVPLRPVSVNAAHGMGRFREAALAKKWVQTVHVLALEKHLPRPIRSKVRVSIRSSRVNRRYVMDPDNLAWMEKRSIDGLRAAGVLVDDTPAHMVSGERISGWGPWQLQDVVELIVEEVTS